MMNHVLVHVFPRSGQVFMGITVPPIQLSLPPQGKQFPPSELGLPSVATHSRDLGALPLHRKARLRLGFGTSDLQTGNKELQLYHHKSS